MRPVRSTYPGGLTLARVLLGSVCMEEGGIPGGLFLACDNLHTPRRIWRFQHEGPESLS